MFEIILIILCIVAAMLFRKAGKKGVGKYIGRVWFWWFVCLFGGGLLTALAESKHPNAFLFVVIGGLIGYSIAFTIIIKAIKVGKEHVKLQRKSEQE